MYTIEYRQLPLNAAVIGTLPALEVCIVPLDDFDRLVQVLLTLKPPTARGCKLRKPRRHTIYIGEHTQAQWSAKAAPCPPVLCNWTAVLLVDETSKLGRTPKGSRAFGNSRKVEKDVCPREQGYTRLHR
jgi:hypothetical protein